MKMTDIVRGDFTVLKGPGPEPPRLTTIQNLLRDIAEEATRSEGDLLQDLSYAFVDACILLDRQYKLNEDVCALMAEVNRVIWPEGESK
jgi:hypothetical protein